MKRFAFAALAIAMACPTASLAATSTGTLQVTATVVNTCAVSAGTLSFGSYNPNASGSLDATGTLNVACSMATPYSVGLNAGTAPGATISSRKMVKASDTLRYSLYRDSSRQQSWGQTVGLDTVLGVGTGLTRAISVYGRIPGAQSVPAGSYSDTVTVTVLY